MCGVGAEGEDRRRGGASHVLSYSHTNGNNMSRRRRGADLNLLSSSQSPISFHVLNCRAWLVRAFTHTNKQSPSCNTAYHLVVETFQRKLKEKKQQKPKFS